MQGVSYQQGPKITRVSPTTSRRELFLKVSHTYVCVGRHGARQGLSLVKRLFAGTVSRCNPILSDDNDIWGKKAQSGAPSKLQWVWREFGVAPRRLQVSGLGDFKYPRYGFLHIGDSLTDCGKTGKDVRHGLVLDESHKLESCDEAQTLYWNSEDSEGVEHIFTNTYYIIVILSSSFLVSPAKFQNILSILYACLLTFFSIKNYWFPFSCFYLSNSHLFLLFETTTLTQLSVLFLVYLFL